MSQNFDIGLGFICMSKNGKIFPRTTLSVFPVSDEKECACS